VNNKSKGKVLPEPQGDGPQSGSIKVGRLHKADAVYVIVHSLFELSFCTQPFPTPIGGCGSYVFDIGNLHVKGREWKVGKGRVGLGAYL